MGRMTTRASALLLLLAAGFRGADSGAIELFDGKTLHGWDGDPAVWRVENGAIVGTSDEHPVKVNTFLIYKRPFADFVLECDVRLRNRNSGIQFRSTRLPGPGWMVAGYQADAADAGDRSAWGNFYEERGRGRGVMRTPDEGWLRAKPVLRKGDWNHYVILARGRHIKLTFNGVVTIDTHDAVASEGVIAFQLHAGEPMRVEFRNIRLTPLP